MNDDLKPVWTTVKNDGGSCYYYGTSLRDYLLKRPVKRFDIVTTHPIGAVAQVLKDWGFVVSATNIQTLKFSHLGVDYVIAHRDPKDIFDVRDFSIDTIYSDCLTGVVHDPNQGVADIKNKLISISKDVLLDSPARLLRAAYLCGLLDFSLSVETWFSMYEIAIGIKHVSPILLGMVMADILELPKPSVALKILQSTRVLEFMLPELAACETIVQNKRAGVHNVFEHTMYALDAAHPDPAIKMAVLFHDIAKPQTIEYGDDGKIHFFRHDVVGAKIARNYLKSWGYEKDFITKVSTLITHHMFDAAPNITDKAVRRLIKKVGKEHIYDLLLVREADRSGSPEKISMKKIKSLRKKIDKEIGNV